MTISQIIENLFFIVIFSTWFCILSFFLISRGKNMISKSQNQDFHLLALYQKIVGYFMVIGGYLTIVLGILGILGIAFP